MSRLKKRNMLILLGVIIVILSVIGFNYLQQVKEYQNTVENITFSNIDITKIPDGQYIGECDVQFIYAKVKVTVSGGRIQDITLLEHRNERGAEAETITDKIVEEQKVDVDAVAGATNSSKVIKKAVENALLQ